MRNNSFLKQILLLVSIVLFVSCDKEYNVIGDGLIGQNHFMLKDSTFSVVAYNQKIGPLQSNNLPVNALGIYNNPAFGKTTASFVTQVSLASVNPIIGNNPKISNVILSVPYFFDPLKTVLNSDGSSTYVLDSIYGVTKAKIKLSVYESGYFMNTNQADGFTPQLYYTNQNSVFNSYSLGNRLNDSTSVAQNDAFFFDPAEISVKTKDAKTSVTTTTRTPPAMHLNLNTAYFMSKILNAGATATSTGSGNLLSNDAFSNYFKGLYFKVEQSGSDPGSMAMMNFTKGTITINYTEDLVTTVGTVATTSRVAKSIVLNMTGNTVSLLDQSNTNTDYSNATSPSAVNTTLGDEKLYLKGGEGSMAILDLFGPDLYGADGKTGSPNGVADQLDIIRKKGWLINEANLIFNIDAASMTNSYEPQRIYLFDLNNRRPVLDYFVDGTSGTTAKKAKTIFDGNINLDPTSKRGSTYKIRITNQIRNLVKYTDSTNVKMGVVVTENIALASSNKWQTPKTATTIIPEIPNYNVLMPKWPDFNIETPKASVMNPLGTILYGSKSTVSDNKRLKLQIFYTKPN